MSASTPDTALTAGSSSSSAPDSRSTTSLLPPPVPRAGPSGSHSSAVGSLRNASNGEPDAAQTGASSPSGGTAATGSSSSGSSNTTTTNTTAPVKPVNRSAASKRAIIYSAVQRRNPVLQAVHALKSTPTEIGDIPADYQVGLHNGLLFLSLKYHRLHPEYIHTRIEKIRNMYNYRVLMVLCDVNEHQQSIRELSKIAVINDLAMFVAWTNDEVAQYLVTLKAYENKSADTLKERVHQEYKDQLQHVLTTGKRVNKTDAGNLASQFGSFRNIARQEAKALSGVKGLGAAKVTSLVEAFHKPFLAGGLKRGAESTRAGDVAAASAVLATPTVPEGAVSTPQAIGGKGKQRAGVAGSVPPTGAVGVEEDKDEVGVEEIGSPEWPDSDAGSDADPADPDAGDGVGVGDDEWRVLSPPRGRVPSRSPERQGGEGRAWRDPLDEEEEEETEEGEEAEEEEEEDEQEGAKKRRRV